MDVTVRFGENDDSAAITNFIMSAGDGLFEFLLDGILPGIKARELIRMAVTDATSPLVYSNALLAEIDGRPVGLILGYPSEQYGIPPIVETIVPRRRLQHVAEILSSRIDDSWYINSVAVAPEARGCGVARLLLTTAADLAREQGFERLSLHAWADNAAALSLYGSLGFEAVRDIAVAPAERLTHSGTMRLMSAPLPLPGFEAAVADQPASAPGAAPN